MKVNAICLVKNEVDVINETIDRALLFCHRIYVFDNGSTDGTYELLKQRSYDDPSIVVAIHSDECFKEQFRNRIYNLFHHQYSSDDWWLILDADEMLVEDPRARLAKAAALGKNFMRVWQAQFYFTDRDMADYATEDHDQSVVSRRKFYRVNWREPRFFKNDPQRSWSESESGRVPSFCRNVYRQSPMNRHYAQRNPDQIQQRHELRLRIPGIFQHEKRNSKDQWVKKASDCFVYQEGQTIRFPIQDRTIYYIREFGFWCSWRLKSLKCCVNKLKQMTVSATKVV